jgi:5-methylcytosine-specific restriction endonuclease McrA
MNAFMCLVLTPRMSPHQTIAWQESVCLDYQLKADILERYEETVRSPTVTMRIPAVARLVKTLAHDKQNVKFSRTNVYARDGYRCCYCGKRPPADELNYDHVTPRSKGGKTNWENIVTSCIRCNSKKDNRTPRQAGMKLLKQPQKPKSLPLSSPILLPRDVPSLWVPYLSDRMATLRAG